MKKVFITGEAGSLASHLAPLLISNGYHISFPGVGSYEHVTPYSRTKELNVLKPTGLGFVDPDILFHLAALVSTPRCEEWPELAFRSNVESCFKLATEVYKPGMFFVYFGTTVMHDVDAERPFKEDSPVKPLTTYGLTKWLGEEVLRQLIRPEDLLIVRPCFVYGGRFDHASVITQLIRHTMSGDQNPIRIPLDPNNMKDYLYIDEFLGGLLKLVNNRVAGTFNLVKGKPEPFQNVLDALKDVGLWPTKAKVILEPDKDYLGHHIVDGTKAKQVIDFAPKLSLNAGMKFIRDEIKAHGLESK